MNQDKAKILIILPRQLGDILLGTPMLTEIKKHLPNSEISWLCHGMGKALLETNKNISKIFYLPKRKPELLGNLKLAWREIQLISALRKERFDVVIDALNNPRTSLTSFLSGGKFRVSFSTRWVRNLAFHKVVNRELLSGGYLGHKKLLLLQPVFEKYNTAIHFSDLKDGEKNLIENSDSGPALVATESETLNVVNYLKINGLFENSSIHPANHNNSSYFTFSPTSRRDLRQWTIENFVELAIRLVEYYNTKIVWLWGPGEEEFAKKHHALLSKQFPKHSFFPPLFSLREVGVLCSMSKCFVGVTNGLAHVACASGARTLQIQGPTTAAPWTHPNKKQHRSVQRKEGCISCEKHFCKYQNTPKFQECMRGISSEAVLLELRELLEVPMES